MGMKSHPLDCHRKSLQQRETTETNHPQQACMGNRERRGRSHSLRTFIIRSNITYIYIYCMYDTSFFRVYFQIISLDEKF